MHSVELVHLTPDSESLIAQLARVSNPSNQDNPDYVKLIRYLIKHKHWSPFEMVNMCLKIHTTRSIAAQILRHRSFSFQEFSQRYAIVSPTPKLGTDNWLIPPLPLRRQDTSNRQSSIDDLDTDIVQKYQMEASKLYDQSFRLYKEMLDAGIAKECAREVLPLSTPTTIYMNGSIRSWLHYIDLRSANGTQLEHQKIANEAKQVIHEHLPSISQAMWPMNQVGTDKYW